MSQPQNVPLSPVATPHYESPPRRDREWNADRPGDVFATGQPEGDLLGSQGPDQGFAIKLAKELEDELTLTKGEHFDDVVAGCVAVALKRASAFGRAPVVHDLRCAYAVFGFSDAGADRELVELRSELFEEVHHPHHYAERRAIADAVPTDFLRRPHQKVIADAADWRSVLSRVWTEPVSFSGEIGEQTDAAPVALPVEASPALFGTRFAAWMIDACLLFGLQWIVVMVLARQLQAAGLVSTEPCSIDSPIMCEGPNTLLWIILFALIVVSTFGYHAWFDGALGATPGKRWMGLRVVDSHDVDTRQHPPVGLSRGLVRSVARQGVWIWAFLFLAASPISVDVPSIIFFGVLGLSLLTFIVGAFTASGTSLHDLAADTAVINASSEESQDAND